MLVSQDLSLVASACIFWQKSKLEVRREKGMVELGSQDKYTIPKSLTRSSRWKDEISMVRKFI